MLQPSISINRSIFHKSDNGSVCHLATKLHKERETKKVVYFTEVMLEPLSHHPLNLHKYIFLIFFLSTLRHLECFPTPFNLESA